MTNYEKILKDMSVDRFATMLLSSGVCPFKYDCSECVFEGERFCEFTGMMDKELIEWLESEVEE